MPNVKSNRHDNESTYEVIARKAGLPEKEIQEAMKRIKGKTYSHITSNKIA